MLLHIVFIHCVLNCHFTAVTASLFLRLLHNRFTLNFSCCWNIVSVSTHFQKLGNHLISTIDSLIHIIWNTTLNHYIIQQLLSNHRSLDLVSFSQLVQINNDRMSSIQLQSIIPSHCLHLSIRWLSTLSLHHLHHNPHRRRHLASQQSRCVFKPLRNLHLHYPITQLIFKPETETSHILLRQAWTRTNFILYFSA